MKLQVRHRTCYHYSQLASLSHNHVCLQPRTTGTQKCLETRIAVTPDTGNIQFDTDVFGNATARFNLSQRHKSCDIVVTSLVLTADTQPPLPDSLSVEENLQQLQIQGNTDALMAQDCLLP